MLADLTPPFPPPLTFPRRGRRLPSRTSTSRSCGCLGRHWCMTAHRMPPTFRSRQWMPGLVQAPQALLLPLPWCRPPSSCCPKGLGAWLEGAGGRAGGATVECACVCAGHDLPPAVSCACACACACVRTRVVCAFVFQGVPACVLVRMPFYRMEVCMRVCACACCCPCVLGVGLQKRLRWAALFVLHHRGEPVRGRVGRGGVVRKSHPVCFLQPSRRCDTTVVHVSVRVFALHPARTPLVSAVRAPPLRAVPGPWLPPLAALCGRCTVRLARAWAVAVVPGGHPKRGVPKSKPAGPSCQ